MMIPLATIVMAWLAAADMAAKVVMPSVLSSGMVLQQQSDVRLWGKADAGAMVKVTTSWDGKKYQTRAGDDGRFTLMVSTPPAGLTPYYISLYDDNGKNDADRTVIDNVLIGEVWLCSGQSNMNMRMDGRYGDPVIGALDAMSTSANSAIRMFTVEPEMDNTPHDDCRGEWLEASPATVQSFSAAAYFFARRINEVLGVPVGILHASYGGSRVEAWMSNEAAAPYKPMAEVQNSTILYNGMMAPLVGYGLRGCLWYQGEANVDQPDLYTRLLPAMVSDWRGRWGVGDFPFLYAQIAPFRYNKGEGKGKNSAYLREAQVKCLRLIPNSGMITLSDVGDARTIHPMDKQTVGLRFAYMAMERVYGFRDFPATPPLFSSMTVEGNKATLTFTGADAGLTSYRRPLTDFEVAGADRVFHKAHASFGRGMKTVVVSAREVDRPVAVRYGFSDCPETCLFNIWGLPVSSFRTDEW